MNNHVPVICPRCGVHTNTTYIFEPNCPCEFEDLLYEEGCGAHQPYNPGALSKRGED